MKSKGQNLGGLIGQMVLLARWSLAQVALYFKMCHGPWASNKRSFLVLSFPNSHLKKDHFTGACKFGFFDEGKKCLSAYTL